MPVGKKVELTATDHFKLGGYRADPTAQPNGGVVVLQEIFGVNHHIRAVCDRFAAEGYVALAPALFDRQQRGFECGYTAEEFSVARGIIEKADRELMLRDIQAAIDELEGVGPVSVVGFCLGGTLAFAAAGQLTGITSAVAYYGGRIAAMADLRPRVPVLMHFGEKDQMIPVIDVRTIQAKRPDCVIYLYKEAEHGFSCDERATFHRASAKLAWQRSLAFLKEARANVSQLSKMSQK
jgi:carboxymethylenebutenolidase